MEAHDHREIADPGGVTRKLLDELAERMAALPPERRRMLMNALQGEALSSDLKKAITESGLTAYALAKQAGTSPDVISRFMSGERDLRLETAGKLAAALGLGLRPIDQSSQAPAIAKAAEVPNPATRKAATGKAMKKPTKRAPGGRKPKK